MGSFLGIDDLRFLLSQHGRTLLIDNWKVGSGATAGVIPVRMRNPDVAVNLSTAVRTEIVGATIEFTSGALVGQYRNVTAVAATGQLTLDAVLTAAPTTGDEFVLHKPLSVEVTTPENIAQWGGVAVTGANITPNIQHLNVDLTVLRDLLAQIQSTPGGAIPGYGVQLGGEDIDTGLYSIVRVDSARDLMVQPIMGFSRVFSTAVPLGVGGNFTSGAEANNLHGAITGSCFADQNGQLVIEQSLNLGVNYDAAEIINYVANTRLGFEVPILGDTWRIQFTNTGAAQTVFRLSGYVRRFAGV